MLRSLIILIAIAMAGLAVPAHATGEGASGGTDPVILIGGVVIILLLSANLYLIWRRDQPIVNPPTVNPEPQNGGKVVPPLHSEPGLKGYLLHGFDHNNKTIRLEFTFEELQGAGCIIGRGSDAQKRLGDPRIARVQARLKLDGERLQIEHLRDTNRTTVNGEEVPHRGTRTVKVGDRIRFGPEVELKVGRLTA